MEPRPRSVFVGEGGRGSWELCNRRHTDAASDHEFKLDTEGGKAEQRFADLTAGHFLLYVHVKGAGR